jgi:hypothetical protein
MQRSRVFRSAVLARQDAELKGWLDEHYAVQSAIRERFKGIAVPEGLKEQIISEHKSRTTVVGGVSRYCSRQRQ